MITSKVISYRDIQIDLQALDLMKLAECPTMDYDIVAAVDERDTALVTLSVTDRFGDLTVEVTRKLRLSPKRLLSLVDAQMDEPTIQDVRVLTVNGAAVGVRVTVREVVR